MKKRAERPVDPALAVPARTPEPFRPLSIERHPHLRTRGPGYIAECTPAGAITHPAKPDGFAVIFNPAGIVIESRGDTLDLDRDETAYLRHCLETNP